MYHRMAQSKQSHFKMEELWQQEMIDHPSPCDLEGLSQLIKIVLIKMVRLLSSDNSIPKSIVPLEKIEQSSPYIALWSICYHFIFLFIFLIIICYLGGKYSEDY